MTRDELRTLLAQLHFNGMAHALDAELDRAERAATPAPELVYRLLSEEAAYRRERSLAYRLDQARLPWRWTLESFPFERQPGVSKSHILTLARNSIEASFLPDAEKKDLLEKLEPGQKNAKNRPNYK